MHSSSRRALSLIFMFVIGIAFVPVASAHSGHVYVNGVHLAQWYGLIPLVLGIGIVLGSRIFPAF